MFTTCNGIRWSLAMQQIACSLLVWTFRMGLMALIVKQHLHSKDNKVRLTGLAEMHQFGRIKSCEA